MKKAYKDPHAARKFFLKSEVDKFSNLADIIKVKSMDKTVPEHNKRINQHSRLINDLKARIKTLEVEMAPDSRISESFEQIEPNLDSQEQRFDRLEEQINQLGSKLDIIIEHLQHFSGK